MICHRQECIKKIKLIEQTACTCNKCHNAYCFKHRLAEAHECVYDYKVKKSEEIQKYIVEHKCVNDKIVKL